MTLLNFLLLESTIFVTWVFISHLILNPAYIVHLLLQRLFKFALFCLNVFTCLTDISILCRVFTCLTDISILCWVFIPILEYNTSVWNSWLIHDTQCVERVQLFSTRAIFKRVKLPNMSYADRLINFGLHSLEYRRLYFDLMCFKIVKNLVDLVASEPSSTSTSHHIVQEVTQSKLALCHYHTIIFFSVRVIRIWNSLPDTVVTASTEQILRSRLHSVNLSPFCKCYPF